MNKYLSNKMFGVLFIGLIFLFVLVVLNLLNPFKNMNLSQEEVPSYEPNNSGYIDYSASDISETFFKVYLPYRDDVTGGLVLDASKSPYYYQIDAIPTGTFYEEQVKNLNSSDFVKFYVMEAVPSSTSSTDIKFKLVYYIDDPNLDNLYNSMFLNVLLGSDLEDSVAKDFNIDAFRQLLLNEDNLVFTPLQDLEKINIIDEKEKEYLNNLANSYIENYVFSFDYDEEVLFSELSDSYIILIGVSHYSVDL